MDYREKAMEIQKLLEQEKRTLSEMDMEVLAKNRSQQVLSKNINNEFDKNLTMGQKIADKIADFGGSWTFILLFIAILLSWIIMNSISLLKHSFDPYPFILLNLVLSCLAALQAPIIMMSQNRQAEKDRMQADHDYKVNLQAELEIRQLNWKIDRLMMNHWSTLLEIEQRQTELLEQILNKKDK